MEDRSVEYLLGQIDGKLTGIGLEIKAIREAQKCQSEDCRDCRREIDERIENTRGQITDIRVVGSRPAEEALEKVEAVEKRVDILEQETAGDHAVSGWLDTTLGRIVTIVSISGGLIAVAWKIWDLLVFGRI